MTDTFLQINSGRKIDQKFYEDAMQKAFEQLKNPTEKQKVEFHHSVYGGTCHICSVPWKKQLMSNIKSEYHFYVPGCECFNHDYESCDHEKELIEIAKSSDVPEKYWSCSIKKLDKKNIKPETIAAIKEVDDYINHRLFNHGIIIYGDPGTGKTHMAVAILKAIAYLKRYTAIFVRMSSFIEKLINEKGLINRILERKIILLNDIDKATVGSKTDSEWIKDRIFELFERIDEENKIMIATTNLKDLSKLNQLFDASVISRILASCFLIKVTGDDYRLKQTGVKL